MVAAVTAAALLAPAGAGEAASVSQETCVAFTHPIGTVCTTDVGPLAMALAKCMLSAEDDTNCVPIVIWPRATD